MTYAYETEKPWLFTDDGQRALFAMLDHARALGLKSGAVSGFALMRGARVGDTFKALALVDRLVETGVLKAVGLGWRSDDRIYIVKEPPDAG